jgi:putative ABC transport system permease protein
VTLLDRMARIAASARAAVAHLAGLARGEADDRAMDEEMRFHLDRLTERHLKSGLGPAEARRRARLEFGGWAAHQEAGREALRSRVLEDAARDLRFGWRALRRHPGFALAAVVTIGLGIAAAVTVFTIVDSIYLRPLPVPHADRLVSVYFANPGGREQWPGTAAAHLLQTRATAFEVVASHDSREVLYITGHGTATQRFGAFVSAEYFDLLGLQPYRGRFFIPSEDSVPDRDAVAVLSYDLWHSQFAADPGAVGEHMQVRGRDVTIVGIAPPGFVGIAVGGAPNDVWLPTMMLGIMGPTCLGRPACRAFALAAWLAPDATLAEATTQVGTLGRELGTLAFDRDTVPRVVVAPLRGMARDSRSDYARVAPLLAAIAVLLLVIACANVGGLLVTRGLARSPEVALRYSLGASYGRVIRQLLAEDLLIGAAGGAVGVALSTISVRGLMGFFSADSEGFPHFFYLSLDGRVLLFALAASLGAVALFGVLPAIATSRRALAQHATGSRVAGQARGRLLVIGAQVALSVTLLVGAALMARSFLALMHRQRFDPAHVALIRVRPEQVHYDPPHAQRFLHEVVAQLEKMPEVTAVALGRGRGFLWTEGPNTMALGRTPADTAIMAYPRFVSPGFLAALRIPLLAGREFTDDDDARAPLVAIVTESVSRALWPDGGALDRTIVLEGKPFRVVGVARDFVVHTTDAAPLPLVLVPFWQNAFQPEVDARLAVRVRGDPVAALPALRRAITAVDPAVPVTEMMPLTAQVALNYTAVHLGAVVLLVSAGTALFLVGLGLYGVIAYLVERRTREIGVRIAMGARPAQIVGLMVRQGLGAILAGGAVGLVIAALSARLLAAYLVGVRPGDHIAFSAAALAVVLVGAIASYLPARHASRVDPMTALRVE